jgi:hypothetical protein
VDELIQEQNFARRAHQGVNSPLKNGLTGMLR